jgi:gliding motility-associated-like protein
VNASSFQLIDSVSGNSTQYKNDLLCPNSYCYYVQAVQRNGRFTSNSNQVCKSPAYTAPSKMVELLRTTVLPNGSTYTQWLPYKTVKQVNHYVISKTYPSGSTNSYYAQVDSQGFIDVKSVDTKNNSYQYSVRAVDHCGAESPNALPHNTILLKGKAQDYTAQLNWNQYLKWYSGVKQYEVQVRRTDSFKTIAYLPKNQNTLTYDFSKENLEDSVCFVVKAIKDSSAYLESVSNCFCVLANAKITVPNVFTPNKDGHNEVFLPKAIFIFNQPGHPVKSYHLTIFNRWGEQVFASDDLGIGWDGYYKGQLCPDGHYVYRIQALALDGVTTFDIHGVFSLLR